MIRPNKVGLAKLKRPEAFELSPAIIYKSIPVRLYLVGKMPVPIIPLALREKQKELKAKYEENFKIMVKYCHNQKSKRYLAAVKIERKLDRKSKLLNKKIRDNFLFGHYDK